METIGDIYTHFKIPPQLQLHQLRVAAVGKIVSDALSADTRTVVLACLLHDMGNIIKFRLDRFPEFLEPEGHAYWKEVQDDYKKKYGTDEHVATLMICDELGVSDRVLTCIRAVGMTKVHSNLSEGTREECITNYADLRVGPRGLVSIVERIADGKARYGNTHDGITFTEVGFRTMTREVERLEVALTTEAFKPQHIDESRVTQLAGELKSFTVRE